VKQAAHNKSKACGVRGKSHTACGAKEQNMKKKPMKSPAKKGGKKKMMAANIAKVLSK